MQFAIARHCFGEFAGFSANIRTIFPQVPPSVPPRSKICQNLDSTWKLFLLPPLSINQPFSCDSPSIKCFLYNIFWCKIKCETFLWMDLKKLFSPQGSRGTSGNLGAGASRRRSPGWGRDLLQRPCQPSWPSPGGGRGPCQPSPGGGRLILWQAWSIVLNWRDTSVMPPFDT